jgi:signal transduction histidine kinase
MVASGTVPRSVPQGRQPRNPISRAQVERVLSRSVAAFSIVFAVQTVPALLGQLDEGQPWWLWSVVPLLFGWLLVTLVFSIAQVWVRRAFGAYAIFYLVGLVTWPFAIVPGAEVFGGIHWINYLITVATAMATIAFSVPIATVYLLLAPTIYVTIRMTPAGGGADWQLAVLEGIYATLLGGAVVILMTMLRQAASTVDAAQATAIARYEYAVRQHATEVERVQVDSIVHDSVLTTLLSAARAYTPEAKALAATMAGDAIGHLRDAALAAPADDSVVRVSAVAQRITETAAEVLGDAELRVTGLGTRSIPAHAAEAVYSAAVQAMVNSLQHAGAASRWVAIRGVPKGGIEVVVGDTGQGFHLVDVPDERLGVRVSILERVANAGGRAVIQSAPGEGTIISIRWPHAVAPSPEPVEVGA